MDTRFQMHQINPESYKVMAELERYVSGTGQSPQLRELIKIRASQLNGCAFCIDMHTKDARKQGETEQRIYGLNAWREAPFYTPEERAVLAFTEAVTLISEHQVPDDVYSEMQRYFDDKEISEMLMQIIAINAWNRIGITTKLMPPVDD
ncbi:AhpD family alkylhydroperoxidase [Pullulanibacillus pueri]|uniref:Carboxymuconolactone decarboxylase-like domain-containing protein n=1 Tax=Pullulanibacillus pueri TaxID=1437324 RepID=A0A8J2ZWJ3_9BACL|nr:carboxymuconolactone decarboxylase family protein [Pullulanibacillus pueri]MBM7682455.1 AhpD family alkylhydroperoxidase [Pullulanibacillus pueri]GGH81571.1 hypothetical protein GCM10007096_19660 [Pullulanibacillus pueri]